MEHERLATVIVEFRGDLNPAIFQPDWLAANDLIDRGDREYALEPDESRVVVSAEFTGSQYPWVVVETTRRSCRLTALPATETPDRIRDLGIGMFELLDHTPLRSLGVTYHWHLALEPEHWDALATRLAPPEPVAALIDDARLETLEYVATRGEGELTLGVEPSHREGFTAWIYVEDERDLEEGPDSAARAVQLLDKEWDEMRSNADRIMTGLVEAK